MLIGISGHMGGGKSTLAKMLVEQYRFKEYTFANSLKEYLIKYFPVNGNIVCGAQKDRYTRRMMQALGSFVREEIDKEFWISKLDEVIAPYTDKRTGFVQDIVISDVRYKNEADYIRSKGGILIRITRDIPSVDTHLSETELDSYILWNYTIKNNGTIEDLNKALSDIMVHEHELERRFL